MMDGGAAIWAVVDVQVLAAAGAALVECMSACSVWAVRLARGL